MATKRGYGARLRTLTRSASEGFRGVLSLSRGIPRSRFGLIWCWRWPPSAGKLRVEYSASCLLIQVVFMLHLAAQIDEAVAEIGRQWKGRPRAGIILGTGIGPLAEEIKTEAAIDYESIPHFLRSTATGHRGRLVCGTLGGVSVVAMEGR